MFTNRPYISTTQNVGSVSDSEKLPRLNLPCAAAMPNSWPGPSGIVNVSIAAQAIAPNINMMPCIASVHTTAAMPPSSVYTSVAIPVQMIIVCMSQPNIVLSGSASSSSIEPMRASCVSR